MKHPKINLHRAWDMFKRHEHPSKETLDHIALLAGFQTWDNLHSAFQEECSDERDVKDDDTDE